MSPADVANDTPASSAARIFISYKRGVEPDVALAQFLYDSLTSRGHRVFKDVEGIPTGTDYAELISSEITGSDFFIVLLTASSTRTGWVAAETEMAKDSADHAGRPKILPVRLAYNNNLPLRLKAAIGHLHHFEWHNRTDNQRLFSTLLDAIGVRGAAGALATPDSSAPPSRLVRGEHVIVTESMWHPGANRESLAGTTVVPVLPDQETSLSVTRGTGPSFFRVKILGSGALEVAIWSGAKYRRVRSQPRKFVTMLESDTHAWCFARYHPDQSVLLKRPGGRQDPIVVTFDPDVVRAVWMITHQRASLHENFLVVMKSSPAR